MMFKSPPKATPAFNTQEAVAISICVSPEAGIITSFILLKTRSLALRLVLDFTSFITFYN